MASKSIHRATVPLFLMNQERKLIAYFSQIILRTFKNIRTQEKQKPTGQSTKITL